MLWLDRSPVWLFKKDGISTDMSPSVRLPYRPRHLVVSRPKSLARRGSYLLDRPFPALHYSNTDRWRDNRMSAHRTALVSQRSRQGETRSMKNEISEAGEYRAHRK